MRKFENCYQWPVFICIHRSLIIRMNCTNDNGTANPHSRIKNAQYKMWLRKTPNHVHNLLSLHLFYRDDFEAISSIAIAIFQNDQQFIVSSCVEQNTKHMQY